jgi:hypothetical protein
MQQNRDGDDVPVFILRAFRTTESSIATLDNRVSLLQSSKIVMRACLMFRFAKNEYYRFFAKLGW